LRSLDADGLRHAQTPDLVLGDARQIGIVRLHDQSGRGPVKGNGEHVIRAGQAQHRYPIGIKDGQSRLLLATRERLAHPLLTDQKWSAAKICEMALQRFGRIVGAVELRQRRIGPAAGIRRLSEGQRARSVPANLFQHGQNISLIQPQRSGQNLKLFFLGEKVGKPRRDDLGRIGLGAQGHGDREGKRPCGLQPSLALAQRQRAVSGHIYMSHLKRIKPDRNRSCHW